jgi:3-dehydroquinate synthase
MQHAEGNLLLKGEDSDFMNVVDINLKEKSYRIYIKRGILNCIGEKLEDIYKGKNVVVITDYNVEKLYLNVLKKSLLDSGFEVNVISIEPGEKSKTLDVLKNVYRDLCKFNIRRNDIIISFGGGVVGDLGGFAAATYLRGIKYIQVPTSILAQVDSSIGGKVAVDLPWGKNLVGNFYHPDAVFIDPDVLSSLKRRFFSDGMSEVIKYGFIRDKSILKALDSYSSREDVLANIEDIIYKCCSIKKQVVEIDEMDLGSRMILNFGHTLGHAIERYYNYDRYSHGEAIAIGMTAITGKTEKMGITKSGTYDYMKFTLDKYGLPTCMPNLDKQSVMNSIALDKKSLSGNILNLIVLKETGKAVIMKVKMPEVENFLF